MARINTESGFASTEVIIALFAMGVFAALILQSSHISAVQQQRAASQSVATTMAQSNLHKFPSAAAIIAAATPKQPLLSVILFTTKPLHAKITTSIYG